jgi:hypothetical protein
MSTDKKKKHKEFASKSSKKFVKLANEMLNLIEDSKLIEDDIERRLSIRDYTVLAQKWYSLAIKSEEFYNPPPIVEDNVLKETLQIKNQIESLKSGRLQKL